MNAQDVTIEVLDLLEAHERVIGKLYAAYAERFPTERTFWQSLSQEEDKHAECIASLRPKIENDPDSLIVARFPTVAIEHSIAYINKLIDQADHPSLTRTKALSAAMNIETALLENKSFEVFASNNPSLRRVLELLEQGTQSHLQRVRQLWASAAQPNS